MLHRDEIEIVPLERTKLHSYTNLLSPHVHYQFHRLICTHLSTSGPDLVAYALYAQYQCCV